MLDASSTATATRGESGMERVCYEQLTPRLFRERIAAAPIAYLPLGTLEWHGEHLPLGSDALQSRGFFIRLAQRVGGIVLPPLYAGPDYEHKTDAGVFYGMDFYGFADGEPRQLDGSAYWVDDAFFEGLLDRVIGQLHRAGFRIVVGHGHAPSTQAFIGKAEDWAAEPGVKVLVCWREDESDGLGIQTDHAAANETSLMMALHPDLVEMENLDPDPDVFPVAVGGDDPRSAASPERGEKAMHMQLERMDSLLRRALDELK